MPRIELLVVDAGDPHLVRMSRELPSSRYQTTSFPNAESMLIHVMRNIEAEESRHRCALLKQGLNGMSGIEAQQHLRKLDPSLVSVLYSDAPTVNCVIEAWRSGADDFLVYPFGVDELNSALNRIIDRRIQKQVLSENNHGYGQNQSIKNLTKREREIIRLIAEGKKNEAICAELYISLATVKMHRSNLMRKLDVHNAAQLMTYYHKNIDHFVD